MWVGARNKYDKYTRFFMFFGFSRAILIQGFSLDVSSGTYTHVLSYVMSFNLCW